MHIELRSKLIDAVEYDEDCQHLTLFMSTGQIRVFTDVPEHVFRDLQATKSPDSYYMKLIKDRYPSA